MSTGSLVDDGHRLASCDTSLVVSGDVIVGEDDKMFMTRSLDVTPKTLRYVTFGRIVVIAIGGHKNYFLLMFEGSIMHFVAATNYCIVPGSY